MKKQAAARLSERALQRRAKVRTPANLVDEHDLPVSANYLQSLRVRGHEPLVISRWLNAASFWLSPAETAEIRKLPFVKMVALVARSAIRPRPQDIRPAPGPDVGKTGVQQLNYGLSFAQNDIINVPPVHDLGITGTGVLIGMLDTGFKYDEHEALVNIEVAGERDFINNDDVTQNEPGQDNPNQHDHGTMTLATIGGFREGRLIGTAFGATFLLAKTEMLTQEIPQEEDNWVAGLEWLEAQGADVVSSSLGYLDWYLPEDMDGNTAVTTRAADLAVSRGLVVVNSAGNEGNSSWRTIIAPADGDSVIAVGAVASETQLAFFSSVGPTADGRTKPDVVGMGVSVYVAAPSLKSDSSRYAFVNGTSFSCPAVAGVAALMLSAHPELTPVQVREALRATADRAGNPDNFYGWGLVDALQAVLYHGPAFSNSPEMTVNESNDLEVSIKVASNTGMVPQQVSLFYASRINQFEQIMMQQGSEAHQYIATIPELPGAEVRFYFQAADSSGTVVRYPGQAPASTFAFTFPGGELADGFLLQQNYPNPFNNGTTIRFDLAEPAMVTLSVYNLLGQEIRVLVPRQEFPAGIHEQIWDGTDSDGKLVPSGIYFSQLKSRSMTQSRKMILMR